MPLSTTSSTSSGSCSSQPQGLHLSSTICSNYHVRPLPVIPFPVNNNNNSTADDKKVMIHQRCQTTHSEQNARTRRVNKRRWAGPNVASEDEPMSSSLSSLTKRPRQHRAHDHHRTSSTHTSTAPLMEIDLIVSHVLGYLSWREQLHCRRVSKVWREAYLSAPTRFLLDTAAGSSAPPSPLLPRVLQPSPLDRCHNQISWISMTRIGSVTTKLTCSTTTTNALTTKRISRLDMYGSPGGDSSFRRHPSSGSNHHQALHTMQILNHITIHPSFLVEELRLLYINRDDLNRYLNKYSGLVGCPALGDSGPLPPL